MLGIFSLKAVLFFKIVLADEKIVPLLSFSITLCYFNKIHTWKKSTLL